MENPRPAHLRPKSRPHCGRLASETRLRTQCGAVWLAGGRISDPRPLSCTFFDPPVHLPLSVVLISPDGTHRPHAFDTAAFAMDCGLFTLRASARPHSGAQAVTLSCTFHCGVRVPLRLDDVQPPCPSAPTVVRRTDRGPVGSGGWCRADCRCASDQPWW